MIERPGLLHDLPGLLHDMPGLLHNMSVPPGKMIVHQAPSTGAATLRFHLEGHNWTVERVLAELDGTPWNGSRQEAEAELRDRINARAASLPFPAAVLVVQKANAATESAADLLTICTVLAKSSSRIYLRDKEPNLDQVMTRPAVVLQLPAVAGREVSQ